MTDIQALRKLIADVGGTVSLHGGHMGDPNHSCDCRAILDERHMGSIAQMSVHNGIESVAEGGNDCPKQPLAVAYMNLLVGAANALPGLLDELETLRGN